MDADNKNLQPGPSGLRKRGHSRLTTDNQYPPSKKQQQDPQQNQQQPSTSKTIPPEGEATVKEVSSFIKISIRAHTQMKPTLR